MRPRIPDRLRPAARRLVQRSAYLAIGAVGFAARLGSPSGRRTSRRERADLPRRADADHHRILLIRLDLMGDVLFALPLAGALRRRYPSARIVMLTLPYTAPIARLSPAIDQVVEVDTNLIRCPRGMFDPSTWRTYLRVVRTLRAERFDLAISIYGQMASLWAFLSGARRSVGYVEESYPFLLSDPLGGGRHRARIHEIEYAQRLGEHVDAPRGNMVQLQVPEDARRRGDRILCRHGVTPSERIVVIHAGAVNGSAKRWPAACWSEFADELIRRINVRVVLAGGRADAELAEEVTACASSPVISLAGETDLVELAAILARADLVASGDSGPLHLARALGRPVLAAYGPTDPAIYGPFSSGAPMRLHRADLPCSPCYTLAATAECPLGDPICMRLIPVRSMVDSALELLAGSEDELAVTQQDALQDPK